VFAVGVTAISPMPTDEVGAVKTIAPDIVNELAGIEFGVARTWPFCGTV